MKANQKSRINKKFHPQAEKTIKQFADSFQRSLIDQARFIASISKADIVLSVHVEEAHNFILSREKKKRSQDLIIAFGGIFLGAAVSGILNEFSLAELRALWIGIYIFAGALGITLMFLGYLLGLRN